MTDYEPELGQAIFGQPHKQYACPEIMDAAMMSIQHELERVMWNLRQKSDMRPFENSGDAFRCETFGVWSSDWSEDRTQPYNFKHRPTGLEISWYKYFGRGMSSNMEITPEIAARVLDDCLTTIRSFDVDLRADGDRECERPFRVGSVGDVPYFETH